MRSLLVVDDDREMVRTICDILQLRGWTALGAFSGEEAIELVRQRTFSTVLMDVRMAGMNGVETMKELRTIRPGLRVVLMTAYSAADLLAEAEREGALRVLAKPIAVGNLLTMLEEASGDAPRVLVVDDDKHFLETLSTALRQHGYATLEAEHLDQALNLLEERDPKAVLLDLCLDDVAPRESVLAIKRLSPAVVLILFSGHSSMLEDAVASLPSSWILATLRKPFAPDRLLELLDDVIAT